MTPVERVLMLQTEIRTARAIGETELAEALTDELVFVIRKHFDRQRRQREIRMLECLWKDSDA